MVYIVWTFLDESIGIILINFDGETKQVKQSHTSLSQLKVIQKKKVL